MENFVKIFIDDEDNMRKEVMKVDLVGIDGLEIMKVCNENIYKLRKMNNSLRILKRYIE